jgi:hypothetical protein
MTVKSAPFVWHDLVTGDLKAAQEFYQAVIGWTIRDSDLPGMAYLLLEKGGFDAGGMMAAPDGSGMPAMWNLYVHSPDVDADVKRAEKLGGSTCSPPQDIPGVGRFAVMADPGGAVFSMFTPAPVEQPQVAPRGTDGHVEWHDLRAADGRKAWNFYSEMFGWTKTDAMAMGPDNAYQMFAAGGDQSVGGMSTMQPGTPMARWTLFFTTDAIDAAVARVKKAGGSITMEPMEVPGGQWIIEATDPQGAPFGLVANRK